MKSNNEHSKSLLHGGYDDEHDEEVEEGLSQSPATTPSNGRLHFIDVERPAPFWRRRGRWTLSTTTAKFFCVVLCAALLVAVYTLAFHFIPNLHHGGRPPPPPPFRRPPHDHPPHDHPPHDYAIHDHPPHDYPSHGHPPHDVSFPLSTPSFHPGRPSAVRPVPSGWITHGRKALVVAGYRGQKVDWMANLSDDWQVFHYFNDDLNAKYRTPRNAGHEAMHYLSYIIDEYYRLPEFIVFVHGHRRSWHQPEPLEWKLESLNFTALEQDKFINFRCSLSSDDSEITRVYDLTDMSNATRPAHKLIPLLWEYMDLGELPTALHSACCSQFAVHRDAILARSHSWWQKFQRPMMEDLGWPALQDKNRWGFMYEQMWHVAFGMDAWHKIPQDYCYKTQWSNGIWCDLYPSPPLGYHTKNVVEYLNITCFKNTNNTQDWNINVVTKENFSDIRDAILAAQAKQPKLTTLPMDDQAVEEPYDPYTPDNPDDDQVSTQPVRQIDIPQNDDEAFSVR